MDYMPNHDQNHGQKAVTYLVKDITILAEGINGKTPEEIDFNVVLEYLDLLKAEATRVAQGMYAKDNSIYYTSGGEISFEKVQEKNPMNR